MGKKKPFRLTAHVNSRHEGVHTLVGHLRPDWECCTGLFALRLPLFAQAFDVRADAKLKFIPAGPLRAEDWGSEGITNMDGTKLEEQGFLGFDCVPGSRLNQHGKMAELQGKVSSLDLMVQAAGCKDLSEYTQTLKFIFDLVSRNDLTGEEIVRDTILDIRWPNTQRTLRNLITALNLIHPDRPDVVVDLVGIAYHGVIAFAEAEARRVSGNPQGTLSSLSFEEADQIARSAFLVPNILQGLRMSSAVMFARFVHEYETAFNRNEAEWQQAVRDYYDPKKTKVVSGVWYGNRQITVAIMISKSVRTGTVCRYGNWSKADYGQSRDDQTKPARRGAQVVVHFHETNQREFNISSSKGMMLHEVAAAIRAADVVGRGIRGLSPDDVRAMVIPGHAEITRGGKKFPLLYLAEFGTAFGHLRSGAMAPTVLTKDAIKELVRRALTEGLSEVLINDILSGEFTAVD